jgi:hypothetical protein
MTITTTAAPSRRDDAYGFCDACGDALDLSWDDDLCAECQAMLDEGKDPFNPADTDDYDVYDDPIHREGEPRGAMGWPR